MSGEVVARSTRLERRLAARRAKQNFIKNNWGEWVHRFKPQFLDGVPIPHNQINMTQAWLNRIFSVQEIGLRKGWVRLMIRRHDSMPIGWAELQRIKNELLRKELFTPVTINTSPAEPISVGKPYKNIKLVNDLLSWMQCYQIYVILMKRVSC